MGDRTRPAGRGEESMWMLDRLSGRSVQTLAWLLTLRGELDRAALRAALDAVVARYDALRTRFAERDGGPVAVVGPDVGADVAEDDLRHLPPGEREAELRRLVAADAATGFDLGRAPLLRARLVRCGDTEHRLLLVVHHIVFDGASLEVLLAALGREYGRRVAGPAGPEPPEPVALGDVVAAGDPAGRDRAVAYWRSRLRGAPPLSELPADRPAGPERDHDSTMITTRLGADLVERLRGFARAERTSPFPVLLAGFQLLLARLTGEPDVVVGSPVSLRDGTAHEDLIGLLVGPMAVRTTVDRQESFRALVGRVRTGLLEAMDHRSVPFETVLEHVRPERSAAHSPLFQIMFGYSAAPSAAGPDGVSVETIEPVDTTRCAFPLEVIVLDDVEGLRLVVKYAPARYDRARVERAVETWTTVLTALLRDPDGAVGEVAGPIGPECGPDRPLRVRGFPVDPAAVEAALCVHPAVGGCAVTAAPGRDGTVAHLVARPGAARPASEQLREHVASRLPDYQVPDAFGWLDAFPLTATGEVDHDRLPALGPDVTDAPGDPDGPLVRCVCAVWQDHLPDGEDVRPGTDFYAAGGHSLVAMRIASSLQELFAAEVTAQTVLRAATPVALAGRLVRAVGDERAATATAELVLELLTMTDDEAADRLTELGADGRGRS